MSGRARRCFCHRCFTIGSAGEIPHFDHFGVAPHIKADLLCQITVWEPDRLANAIICEPPGACSMSVVPINDRRARADRLLTKIRGVTILISHDLVRNAA